MEQENETKKNSGGRPKKQIKRDQLMAIKCTLYERKIIETKAKKSNLTISEYLREIGLTGKIDCRNKALPKEILSFTGVLNHLAANLNQIAKKRNNNDELSPLERAELKVQAGQVKDLAVQIKSFMS
ncbi:mobilization protein [Flavobacterium sp. HBTb2-11-1]|uniref:plasmid mobilization protein n=1 Tax=Flavobacterium sp. HBTb2-11-1 TaxID=2692212 RepID=UPI001368C90D|nr:mobilization protein [Flavobacterium sp. HBTb2-11-1]MXO06451.1 mobilization protein [Flavobacterium sp. HBTb2-11-1]